MFFTFESQTITNTMTPTVISGMMDIIASEMKQSTVLKNQPIPFHFYSDGTEACEYCDVMKERARSFIVPDYDMYQHKEIIEQVIIAFEWDIKKYIGENAKFYIPKQYKQCYHIVQSGMAFGSFQMPFSGVIAGIRLNTKCNENPEIIMAVYYR